MSTSLRTTAGSDGARRAQRILENLFLALTALYLAHSYRSMTMFKPVIPKAFVPNLMLAMELAVLARLILRRRRSAEIWLGLPLVWAYVETYRSVGNARLVFMAILVMGLEGIDHRRILKTYFVAVGGLLAATVMAGLGGGIDNLVYVREGLRSSWGTAYPTDFSSLVLFLALAMWVAWPQLHDGWMLAFGLIPLLLAVFVTGSRNVLMCGALFELVILWHWLESGPIRRRDRAGKTEGVVNALLMLALPVCAAVLYLLVALYAGNPATFERLNMLLSDRLRLSAVGFLRYGLSPFGVAIDMNGGMGTTVFSKGDYFFLDSSYVNILLRFGWVTLLAMFASWEWMVRKAIRSDNRRMAMAMAVIAVHAVMEHHFADVFHNIMLVMPLAVLRVKLKPAAEAQRGKRNAVLGAVLAALLVLAALYLPALMSRLRTIYGAKGWQGGGENAWPVLCLNLALVASVAGSAWATYRLAVDALLRRRARPAAFAALAACLAVGVGLWAWGNGVIAGAVRDNASMVEADAGALACLSDFDVCADVMPEVYRQRFANVRRTVLGGDDLTRLDRVTVLTDARPERRMFLNCGYKFAQISDAHALYVSDPGALAALEAAGYSATDYYTPVIELDLQAIAARNDLSVDADGLVLDGPGQSLSKSAGENLYSGLYEADFSLFLPASAGEKSGDVCLLRVQPENREAVASVSVARDQFDADGRATVTVPFSLSMDTDSVRFLVSAGKGRQVGVAGIRYRQVIG